MKIRRFSSDTRGATAIEYGLIAGLIALGMIVGLQALASANEAMWTDNQQKITAALND